MKIDTIAETPYPSEFFDDDAFSETVSVGMTLNNMTFVDDEQATSYTLTLLTRDSIDQLNLSWGPTLWLHRSQLLMLKKG